MQEEIKCPQCGGNKFSDRGNNAYKCMYCGSTFRRHEQQPQRDDEHRELTRARAICVAVVKKRQQIHQDHRSRRAAEDKRHPPPDLRARPITQRAEERQQKQRQHIVRRHDRAGNGLV